MTTATRSAYPPAVDDLLPRALEMAEKHGDVPPLRRLISELRIGAPKARALAERVAELRAGTSTHTLDDLPTGAVEDAAEVPTSTQVAVAVDTPTDAPVAVPVVASEAQTADTPVTTSETRSVRTWPVLLLALPAFVAIWSGWVGLGGLTGFGVVHPLPGIADSVSINSAITLPIGVETYAAYALRVWLSPGVPRRARSFARWSAIGSLALGAAGQVAFHLMTAARVVHAPWWITTLVACLPVAVLGMGAALAHLLRTPDA